MIVGLRLSLLIVTINKKRAVLSRQTTARPPKHERPWGMNKRETIERIHAATAGWSEERLFALARLIAAPPEAIQVPEVPPQAVPA